MVVLSKALAAMRRWASWPRVCLAALALGCGGAPPPSSSPSQQDDAIGVPGRSHVVAASFTRHWVVLQQARADTDGDGVVCSRTDGQHGFEIADHPTAWLVLGSGPGEPLDEYYGSLEDQRFLVFARDGQVEVLDVETSERTTLGPRTASTRWHHLEASESAIVTSPRVVYRRSDREAVVFDPRTGASTTYTIPHGWLFRAFVLNGWLVAEALDAPPADPTSSSEVPHIDSSGGDMRCSLATYGECFGPSGRVILFALGDASHPIDAGRRGVSLASWGLVRASDEGELELVRHPSGHTTTIGATGCNGQLLTLGEQPHYVAYRCEPDHVTHVLVFADTEATPPRDETARIAGGAAAWAALGASSADAQHLASLGETSSAMYFLGQAAEGHPVPQEPNEATAFHRVVPRCGDPLTDYQRETARICAHVGPDVELVAVRADGEALARIRRGAETPACVGDDTQLVWMQVDVEAIR